MFTQVGDEELFAFGVVSLRIGLCLLFDLGPELFESLIERLGMGDKARECQSTATNEILVSHFVVGAKEELKDDIQSK